MSEVVRSKKTAGYVLGNWTQCFIVDDLLVIEDSMDNIDPEEAEDLIKILEAFVEDFND